MLLVAAAHRDLAGRPWVFSRPAVVWLGQVSFCFYLLHQLVIRTFGVFGETSDPALGGLLFVACLLLSLASAALLHHWVELPLEARLRGSRPKVSSSVGTVEGITRESDRTTSSGGQSLSKP
jgi:peptidoglycan/LPS O-acetylase OafA/YrhL